MIISNLLCVSLPNCQIGLTIENAEKCCLFAAYVILCNYILLQTFFQLGQLVNLKSLCLEHGGEIPDVGLGDALVNLKL